MIDWPSAWIGFAAGFMCAPGIFALLFVTFDKARDLFGRENQK